MLVAFLLIAHVAWATTPAWLLDRTRALFGSSPAGEDALAAYPDTLLALADTLASYGNHDAAAQAHEFAGIHAFRHADLERALAIWQDGLAYARAHQSRQREAGLLNALAVGYTVADRTDEALVIHGQALRLKTELGDSSGVSRTWGNLANTYAQLGRVAEALDAGLEAERWCALVGNSWGQASLQLNRAGLMNQLGRPHEALMLTDEILAAVAADSTADAARDFLGVAHQRRAQCLLELGRHEEALASLDIAIAAPADGGASYYALFARQRRIEVLRAMGQASASRAALEEMRLSLKDDAPERLRTTMMLQDGMLLLESGQAQAAAPVLEAGVASFETRRDDVEDEASQAGLYGDGGSVYGALALCKLALQDTVGAWRTVERGRAALFRERIAGTDAVADLAAVQATLADSRAVLLQAVETVGTPLIWFVVDSRTVRAVPAGRAQAMAADARAALAMLAAGEPASRSREPLARLAEGLLGSVLPVIDPDVERLYLIPPSYLDGFPLAMLPLPDGSGGVGDRWSLTYLPGASALVALTHRRAAAGGMVALADPVMGAAATDSASTLPDDPRRQAAARPLPEARSEVAAVAPPDATIWLGEEARLSRLTSAEAAAAAVIHVACHALSDPVDGSRSALLLAPEPGDVGPAVLQAAAVESLSLRTDLAVLSACRSGLGRSILGEGGFGLPRSLLIAGARSVVSSVWDVEDRATREFMERFYTGLAAGLPRDQALHDAGRALAAAGAPPRDWAGFILTGVGHEPVAYLAAERHSGSRRWWLGLMAAVILAVVIATTRRRRRLGHHAGV